MSPLRPAGLGGVVNLVIDCPRLASSSRRGAGVATRFVAPARPIDSRFASLPCRP